MTREVSAAMYMAGEIKKSTEMTDAVERVKV